MRFAIVVMAFCSCALGDVATKGAYKPKSQVLAPTRFKAKSLSVSQLKNPNNIATGQIFTNISFIAPYDGLLQISHQSVTFEPNVTWQSNMFYAGERVTIPLQKTEPMMFYRYVKHSPWEAAR